MPIVIFFWQSVVLSNGLGNGYKVPCTRIQLPWEVDSNRGPHGWEPTVLSTEPWQLLIIYTHIHLISSFYTVLSHEAQSAYSVLNYPGQWIHFNAALFNTVHNIHTLRSIPSLKLLMTHCHSGADKFKHIICRILPGPHLCTWVESNNVDKLPCGRTKVNGDGGIRTRALSVRVDWIHQYPDTWKCLG